MATYPTLIVHNARIFTGVAQRPEVQALAVTGRHVAAVGTNGQIRSLAGPATVVIDAGKRRLIPGLIDSHIHAIRGGLNYNLELRWDGVPSLADAMRMLAEQVARTPPPQWVRVVGGFSEHQFAEKRLPTLPELNQLAPDTPVFILHLYDRALLNGAALRACGYTRDTPDPPGGQITRDGHGTPTGLLLATPNALLLYSALAHGPRLPHEYQINSSRHFMRELNRLGVTSVIDAGGGNQHYPGDYHVIEELHQHHLMTVRIAYNLFTQKPDEELHDFMHWSSVNQIGQGDEFYRLNGAGEMLVYSAADFEDFRQPRPELPLHMEGELEAVARVLAERRWPWRMHATYDDTIGRALDVFEKVDRDLSLQGLPWFFDHAETVSERNLERIARLGGGIAVQHRMAFQGEYFVERYGAEAATRTPPFKRMLEMGIPVGAGTDATRVASYDPWNALYWLTTGKTLGGLSLYPGSNRVDRTTALAMFTRMNAWFSGEEGIKGQLDVGQLADFAVLSHDYFSVEDEQIRQIVAELTVVDGRIVYADGDFKPHDLAPPPPMPDWSPVNFGSRYWKSQGTLLARTAGTRSTTACCARPAHGTAPWGESGLQGFWGLSGCSCWAF
ncbi:amidohydrolase [Dyella soli]|uniref:Amidohydrolase n=1 Tax=Dyella soli TaxID=522319 RepID=A0A4R0YME9_9GAMM|nr:amidohydrolase [Dyella soli]TCI10059.1 amidohydrolase [Dyella soli]